MQKIATRVFVYSSLVFGVLGIAFVLTAPAQYEPSSNLNTLLQRLLLVTVFVILPSFALSVAGKYLGDKN